MIDVGDWSESDTPGVTDTEVDGVEYKCLRIDGKIKYHHAWYQTFLNEGKLDLAIYNIGVEYGLMLKKIKKYYL